ncbi:MAG: sugar transferase [Gammaproteobacteria bacterium]|nr:sugar transferase [Gammaproteobacteria bacterium]
MSDILSIAVSFYLATSFRLQSSPDYLSLEYIGLNLIILSSLFIGGAYTSSSIGSAPKLPLKTFFTILASVFPSMLFIYFMGPERFTALFGRGVLPFAVIGIGTLAVISRHVINHVFYDHNTTRQILLLGNVDAEERINKSLTLGQFPIKVQHAQSIDPSRLAVSHLSAIVISPDHSPDEDEQHALINFRLAGVPIFSLSDFFESFLFLVPVQEINNDWFIRAEGFTMLHSSVTTRIKRAVDVLVALTLIVVTLPLTTVTALLIKLSSRGPVFFSQTRVGMKGQPFILYKFRTMHVNAERDGAQWASNDDPRILPIGKFLRKSRIDELPQCWNILRGEMSIVGPRPERPEFTSMLSQKIPYYDLRHIIKPGLTGWAQVMYPYGASTDDALKKLQFDLYYIKNYSLLLDLNILMRTVLVTFSRRGR